MTPSIRLGRVFGIEIGFNWSLLFIFALVAWTLASSVLPVEVPHQSLAAYWLAGLAGAAVYFVCLLAHELSHSVVARRRGVRVRGITLWLFGGVSQLEGEPTTAQAEALITAVGPATSLVTGGLAYGLAVLLDGARAPALIVDLLVWLAYLNAALAVFNLIPAFPLDGGRLLSSLLWWRTGTRLRGVHLAVRIGRVFALLMIAAGIFELFAGAGINGIWLAFIGWFLLSAAGAEEAGAAVRALVSGVPVSAAMTSPVVTVPDWLSIEQFLASLAPTYRHTTYPLHDTTGRLSGVTRLRELLQVPHPQRGALRLRDRATAIDSVPRAEIGEDLQAVLQRVGPEGLEQRVLVFDGERLVGILSPNDIARLVTLRRALTEPGRAA